MGPVRAEGSIRSNAFAKRRPMFRNVLVVCTGNICRSPTATIVLRKTLEHDQIEVVSAGLSAVAGQGICQSAAATLKRHGHEDTGHVARQLDVVMVRRADLILAMEVAQIRAIVAASPESRGKVVLLSKWDGGGDIPDPYRQSNAAYEYVFQFINTSVRSWINHL
jgi:protein-tyrosine phosphatase